MIERVAANVARVVHTDAETLQRVVLCLVSEGHLIIEDFPGVGKTMLVKALARSLDCSFSRIQFTPDLLPTDITGVNVYDQRTNEFDFRAGPVFANLLLVDEVNRASPKTQSALLECMQEAQVTVDGVSYALPRPFMVAATQNPIEYEGTYPLPEAQLDRFAMRLSLGYPPLAEEARMLTQQTSDPPQDSLEPVCTAEDVLAVIEDAKAVYVEESVNRYVVAVLRHTRADSRLYLGASPRAGIQLLRVAKARALVAGRSFVSPDDVKAVAEPVLAHRLIVAPEARSAGFAAEDLVREAIEKTPVPV
jgi:MoxR-like ATPase